MTKDDFELELRIVQFSLDNKVKQYAISNLMDYKAKIDGIFETLAELARADKGYEPIDLLIYVRSLNLNEI